MQTSKNNSENYNTRKIPNDLIQLQSFDFDNGIITNSENEQIISFAPIETQPGLTIARNIHLYETKEIEWNIEIKSADFEGQYVHIENIPKSFASDVKDIEFSIKPDIIIDADPSVAWINNISKGITINIKMKLKSSIKRKEATLISLVENFDEIRLIVGLEKCRFAKGNFGRMLCMIDLIGKYPEKFTEKQCMGMSDFDNGMAETQACKAYLSKDITKCQDIDAVPYPPNELIIYNNGIKHSKEDLINDCEHYAYLTGYASCLGKNDLEKDYCIAKQSVWAKFPKGCERISNILPYQRCLAQINQDDDACVKLMNYGNMFSENDYIDCCNLLNDDAYKSRCIEYVSDEKISKTEEENCEEMYGIDEYYLNLCYTKKAKKECEINYCYEIDKNKEVEKCILGMHCGVDNCLSIKSDDRYICIWNEAKTPEECALIGNIEYRPMYSSRYYSQETCNTRDIWPAHIREKNENR